MLNGTVTGTLCCTTPVKETCKGNNILDAGDDSAYIQFMDMPKTLQQAIIYFSDADRTFQHVLNLRFPDGKVACPHCGGERHAFIKTRRIWQCYSCKKQFSLKVGTIFEDSPISLDKWMMGIWMLTNCKNGVSSYEMARNIGITQKSAWFMLHRIREAMKNGTFAKIDPSAGPVEVDEAWVGGKPKNMHKDRRVKYFQGDHKAIVMGMKSRTTREVRAMVVPNVKRETLQEKILDNVGFGSTVYTDGWPGYDRLTSSSYMRR